MIKITFTITGNHQDPMGNPIPFQRVIASQMRYASGRYMQWQSFARAQFDRTKNYAFDIITDSILANGIDAEMPIAVLRKELARLAKKPHPIKIEKYRATMHLDIYWTNEQHGDADNVFKGVADSLFENDKELDGSFTARHQRDKTAPGRIDGIIIFEEGMLYD